MPGPRFTGKSEDGRFCLFLDKNLLRFEVFAAGNPAFSIFFPSGLPYNHRIPLRVWG